ncbi:hypothetical protein RRG08_037140 [Elysia crispata]|uniref:G-protein coupled receptors family 1 profile domain-containing protein n=1 Tax=Elysia crispata TaxID=231223 RepID=A0AAE1A7P2_9GAST|nr:hypothetical protein RRG08_037140 [Elysia crispata]
MRLDQNAGSVWLPLPLMSPQSGVTTSAVENTPWLGAVTTSAVENTPWLGAVTTSAVKDIFSALFPPRPVLYLTVVWVTAGVVALPFVFLTNLIDTQYQDGSDVQVCRTNLAGLSAQLFVTLTFILMFLFPLVLLCFLYFSVISRLRRLAVSQDTAKGGTNGYRGEDMRTSASAAVNAATLLTPSRPREQRSNGLVNPATARSRHQVARMLLVIVALFAVCFTPFKVFTLWLAFEDSSRVESLGFENYLNLLSLCRIVMYINSAGNPIIYAWMSPRFRRAFLLALPRCRRSTHREQDPGVF